MSSRLSDLGIDKKEITQEINVMDEDTIKEKVLAAERVKNALEGKTIRKVIVIKTRLVNIRDPAVYNDACIQYDYILSLVLSYKFYVWYYQVKLVFAPHCDHHPQITEH